MEFLLDRIKACKRAKHLSSPPPSPPPIFQVIGIHSLSARAVAIRESLANNWMEESNGNRVNQFKSDRLSLFFESFQHLPTYVTQR